MEDLSNYEKQKHRYSAVFLLCLPSAYVLAE